MATGIQVTIDCADPDRLARFWAEALSYRMEEPPAGFDSWQAYWVSRGLPEEELEDGYDSIVEPDGIGPRIWPARRRDPLLRPSRGRSGRAGGTDVGRPGTDVTHLRYRVRYR